MGQGWAGRVGFRRSALTEGVTSSVTSQPMGLRFGSRAKQEAVIERMREHICMCALRVCVWAMSIFNDACMCIFGVG